MTTLAKLADTAAYLFTITRDRAVCLARGHKWDSDRPSGPLHDRDICWRCDRTRTPNH